MSYATKDFVWWGKNKEVGTILEGTKEVVIKSYIEIEGTFKGFYIIETKEVK